MSDFHFTFDWLRKVAQVFKPVTNIKNAKPNQMQIALALEGKLL